MWLVVKNLIKLSLMEFLFELLKEFVKAIICEVSAYVFRKQILEKANKKSTLRRCRKQKGGFRKK
ncbi:hypothetical protein CN325_25075 [Bacillus thuringiensis]|nr:hypothetical protein CN325_25075 [Bacillus thuringiensis]